MNWIIDTAPLVPLPWLYAAGALAAILFVLAAWRGLRGIFVRALAIALLIGALVNPTLRREQRDPLSSIVLVVVDRSESQSVAGRDGLTSRLREELSARLALIPNLETRWLISTRKDASGANDGTTLFADLNRGLANIPQERLAGVLMITDGQIHDVPAKPESLGLNVPVHGLITGVKGEFDRRIKIIEAPRFGIVGSDRKVRLRIVQSGKTSNKTPAQLVIRRENKTGQLLTVPIDQTVEIDFNFPHAGQNILELELKPTVGELTMANNRLVLSAQGIRENLRVLLVSGEPHPGERTWRNLLKSDASVDLVHFTILRPPQKQDGTPINQLSLIAFPTRELFLEKLSGFDLIIFDRYKRRGVLPLIYLDNVARYVDRGGAVLIAAGETFGSPRSLFRTPLSQILPVEPTGRMIEQPYRARFAKDGLKHPVTRGLRGGSLDKSTWGRWFRLIETKQRRGKTLMRGPNNKPLLVLARKGEGRVATLLSDHAWLWARGYDGGGPYSALLRRLSHWLMKEPDLEEEFLTASAAGRRLTIERRTMSDKVAPVKVTSPDGTTTTVTLERSAPGLWRKSVKADNTGLYRLTSGKLSAVTHVGLLNSRELSAVTATAEKLQPVLTQSGGGAFWTGTAGRTDEVQELELPRLISLPAARKMYGAGWLGLARRDAYIVRGVQLTPLFNGFLALALALGLLSLTWFREGR